MQGGSHRPRERACAALVVHASITQASLQANAGVTFTEDAVSSLGDGSEKHLRNVLLAPRKVPEATLFDASSLPSQHTGLVTHYLARPRTTRPHQAVSQQAIPQRPRAEW